MTAQLITKHDVT